MIGATAQHVIADPNEDPTLAQDVEPVAHADSPGAMVRTGRDIERRVHARAVTARLEVRALPSAKTIAFHG